jgi:hypothetical protein
MNNIITWVNMSNTKITLSKSQWEKIGITAGFSGPSEPSAPLSRDGRPIRPYSLKLHQIEEKPLSCLWWELRSHGFFPLEKIEARITEYVRALGGEFSFWKLRGAIPEFKDLPAPIIAD